MEKDGQMRDAKTTRKKKREANAQFATYGTSYCFEIDSRGSIRRLGVERTIVFLASQGTARG